MNYNTAREPLILPGYGRCIQQMVDHTLTIEDREERTKCAYSIVAVIINLFPSIKEDANYKQKVWDHIAMMSGYRLDVDAPYPLPTCAEASQPTSKHMKYPMTYIHLRAYGHIVQDMLQKAVEMEDPDERLTLTAMTANFMKRTLQQNGKDSNVEDRICADIADLSDGVLQYDYAQLQEALPSGENAEGYRRPWEYKNKQRNQQWRNKNQQRKYNNKRRY